MRQGPFPIVLAAAFWAAFAPAGAQETGEETGQWNARCAVYRGETLIEENDCNRIVEVSGASQDPTREGGEWVIRYRWASGGSTVTTNVEESFTINGQPGETTGIAGADWSLCVRNRTSKNTFCTRF